VERDDQSLQSTLLRGWYWGSQRFKESQLEQFGQDVKERINRDDRSSPMMRDHGEQEAENILSAACRHFKMTEIELLQPRRGDLTRASVAWRIWRKTTVSQR